MLIYRYFISFDLSYLKKIDKYIIIDPLDSRYITSAKSLNLLINPYSVPSLLQLANNYGQRKGPVSASTALAKIDTNYKFSPN